MRVETTSYEKSQFINSHPGQGGVSSYKTYTCAKLDLGFGQELHTRLIPDQYSSILILIGVEQDK